MKKRILYLDILKIIGILCVCSYHFSWVVGTEYIGGALGDVVWRRFVFGLNCICVPLFFMVNGSLMFSKTYETKDWLKNILFYVVQLLVWRFISIVSIALVTGVNCNARGMRYFANAVFFGEFQEINLSHMWFIYALIIIYLLYPFIKKFMDGTKEEQKYLYYYMATMFVLCFFTKTWTTVVKVIPFLGGIELENMRSFLGFEGMYGPMLFYFILGGILFRNREMLIKYGNWFAIPGFLLGAVGVYVKWYYESKAITATYDNVFWGYDCISGLLLVISVYLFALGMEEKLNGLPEVIKRGIHFAGRNTMGVYYLHWIIGMTVLPVVYIKLMDKPGLGLNFAKAVVLVLICSIISELMGKIPVVKYLFMTGLKNKSKK